MIKAPTLRRLAANDSYTFLMQELERIDEQILEPLSGTDWPRDMPVITGGGLIESVASIDVTYASSGKDDDNLFFDAANEIPVIQADLSKQVARTFNWAEYMSFLNMEELIQCHKADRPFEIKGFSGYEHPARGCSGCPRAASSLEIKYTLTRLRVQVHDSQREIV